MTNLTQLPTNSNARSTHKSDVIGAAHYRLRLLSYPQLRRIACEFHEGVLTLRGVVGSYFLKQVAHRTVKTVIGVEVVADRLEVRYPPADR
jgi:osmotically-inducible protein OsmY